MTPYERENPNVLNSSRKKRIAAGSGTTVVDINRLLKQHEMMQKLTQQMTGMAKRRKGKKGGMAGMGGLGGLFGGKGGNPFGF